MFPSPAQLGVRFAPGTMLGRYELLATIGVGGMASVILARQRGPAGFEKAVVIKLIHPHMAQDAVAVNMLLDEAKVAAQLDHQNIVHTYELGEAHGTYYIVMEYLAGESLGQVMKAGTKADYLLPPFAAAKVVADAAEGLHYAHELTDFSGEPLGIVHRDVSPGNIVVLYNGNVKVVDFGIAKAQGRVTSTQQGELKGKYGYMSPEQINNEPMDRRSDVFSLGVVLWETLARRRLFAADNVAATLMQILKGDRTPPSAFDHEIPHALDTVALRALAPDPRDRFETMAEMKQAIDDAIWKARVGPAEIAAHMQGLFAERMETRRGLLAKAQREPMTAHDLEAFGSAFRDPSSAVSKPHAPLAPETLPVEPPSVSAARTTMRPSFEQVSQPSYSQSQSQSQSHAQAFAQEEVAHVETPSEQSAEALPPPPAMPAWTQGLPAPVIARASWTPPSENLRPAQYPASYPRGPMTSPMAAPPAPKGRGTVVSILVAGAILGVVLAIVSLRGGGKPDDARGVQSTPGSAAQATAPHTPTVSEAMANTPPPAPVATEPPPPVPAPVPAPVREPTVAKVNPPPAPPPVETPPAPPPAETPVEAPPVQTKPRPRPQVVVEDEPKRPRPRTNDEEAPPSGGADGFYKKGTDAFFAGDFAAAEAAFKSAIGLNRGYAAAYRGLGFLYQRTGESAKAVQALRTYLRLAPSAKDGAAIRKRLQQLGDE